MLILTCTYLSIKGNNTDKLFICAPHIVNYFGDLSGREICSFPLKFMRKLMKLC